MSNKKTLIISYYWPPSGGVGVQRWLNYAIQLKNLGWEPIIYTPENPQFEIQDESLLERVKDIRVIKTSIWEPFQFFHRITGNSNRKNVQQGLVLEKKTQTLRDKLFVWIRGNLFVPDPRKYWVKPSVRFLIKFLQEENIQTIITTGPPHSMHLIGLGLKKKANISWIADFRDPWSQWDILEKLNTGSWAMRKQRKLESSVLKSAGKILTVSPHLQKSLAELGGGDRVHLQYNGVSEIKANEYPTSEVLTIGYFGMLNELRNPSELWGVLDEMASSMKMDLRIGGVVAESIREEILSFSNLGKCTNFLGYLSHEEVKNEYAKCQILVLLLNRSNNAKWILPVKFFEYLAAKRWMLALGPTGSDLEAIAKEVATFGMMEYSDKTNIRNFIQKCRQSNPDFSSSQNLLDRFSHANLATELEQILIEING
ncbi:MAG: glycosyltransferase family 4 protein [Cytophagales bacterium]|nr:glycosyltransferase family 4 protein [Cytophagales bacterium]